MQHSGERGTLVPCLGVCKRERDNRCKSKEGRGLTPPLAIDGTRQTKKAAPCFGRREPLGERLKRCRRERGVGSCWAISCSRSSGPRRRNRSSARRRSRTKLHNRSWLRSTSCKRACRPNEPSCGRTGPACNRVHNTRGHSRTRLHSHSSARTPPRSRSWAQPHNRNRRSRRTQTRSQRSTARWRRPASTAGYVSSGGSLTGQREVGPRPWPSTRSDRAP